MATTVQRRAGVISPDPSPGPDYLSDDPLERQWADPPGLIGWLSAVQNDAIGGAGYAHSLYLLLVGRPPGSTYAGSTGPAPEQFFRSPNLQ